MTDTNNIVVHQQQEKQKQTNKKQSTITMLIFEMYLWSPAITC